MDRRALAPSGAAICLLLVIGSSGYLTSFALSSLTGEAVLSTADTRVRNYGGVNPVAFDGTHWALQIPQHLRTGGMKAGEDIVSLRKYHVATLEFQATFSGGNAAPGFDEMVIFCTSTLRYNGTEFGVRYSAQTNQVFGYTQHSHESFQQIVLFANDGAQHSYRVTTHQSSVYFFVDGVLRGTLNASGGKDYQEFSYWITLCVHRFTSGWDSSGYGLRLGDVTIRTN